MKNFEFGLVAAAHHFRSLLLARVGFTLYKQAIADAPWAKLPTVVLNRSKTGFFGVRAWTG